MKNNKMLAATTLSLVGFLALSSMSVLSTNQQTSTRTPASVEENAQEITGCKSSTKEQTITSDIDNELKDKAVVLKQLEDLKKDNKKLKQKLRTVAETVNSESYPSNDNAMIALMGQITTLFSLQMQNQMEMQMQMMSMMRDMQNSMLGQTYTSPLKSSFNFDNMNIGIPATQSIQPTQINYQNPYSMIPEKLALPDIMRMPIATIPCLGGDCSPMSNPMSNPVNSPMVSLQRTNI